LDLNGKKFKWQGVALLPFIDEKRLLDAMNTKYHLLTEDEKARNEPGRDVLLFSSKNTVYSDVLTNFYSKKQGAPKFKLNTRNSAGLSGKVEKIETFLPQGPLVPPFENPLMPDLSEDQSMSVYYDFPVSTHIHKSQLLRGLVPPTKLLDQNDHDMQRHRANKSGRNFGGVPLYQDRPGNDRRRSGEPGGRPINYANPFAQHLDPNFTSRQDGQYRGPPVPPPPQHAGQVPPPWMAAQMGWTPPNFNGGRAPPPANGNYQSYGAPQDYHNNYQGNQQYGQNNYSPQNGQDQYRGNQSRPQNNQGYSGQRNDNRGWNNGGQRDSRGGYGRR